MAHSYARKQENGWLGVGGFVPLNPFEHNRQFVFRETSDGNITTRQKIGWEQRMWINYTAAAVVVGVAFGIAFAGTIAAALAGLKGLLGGKAGGAFVPQVVSAALGILIDPNQFNNDECTIE